MSQWLLWFRGGKRPVGSNPSQATGRLVLLFIGALICTFFVATDNATAYRLFQSPQSPLDTIPAEQIDPFNPEATSPLNQAPTGESTPSEPQAVLSEPAPARQPVKSNLEDTPPLEEEESGSHNFILDQAELIDSVIVSGAYVWVCCGMGLMLLVPFLILVLEIRGRSKLHREG